MTVTCKSPAALRRLHRWLGESTAYLSTRGSKPAGGAALRDAQPQVQGLRAASGSSGGSGSGSGSSAKDKAKHYLKNKQRRKDAEEGLTSGRSCGGDGSGGPPPSRLAEAAAEFTEAQQAFLLSSPSGLGVGAEAAIARSIAEGALDNLPGKGKPLRQEDHGAQFYRVDPLVHAAMRTMGAQNVRPLSLELKEDLDREMAALRLRLAAELRRAVAGQRSVDGSGGSGGSDSGSSSSSMSGGDGDGGRVGPAANRASAAGSGSAVGWLGRWFGGAVQGQGAAGSSAGTSGQQTVENIRAGQHPGLQHAAGEVQQLIQQYNSAALADKEAFGAFWPLNQVKQLDWAAELERALAEIKSHSQ